MFVYVLYITTNCVAYAKNTALCLVENMFVIWNFTIGMISDGI